MFDPFTWYDPWAALQAIEQSCQPSPSTEPAKPPPSWQIKTSEGVVTLRGDEALDYVAMESLFELAREVGTPAVKKEMKALGYFPLRACPLAEQRAFVEKVRKRLSR